ncbi:MAG: malto-oligosyltrehalose trehalohydrolase [Verrucomicrobiae bacterium]|nr:malto-oligosyltrehalose trehalohydrolase [Verrucomicrobiae bacterium]
MFSHFGAHFDEKEVHYQTWAPSQPQLNIVIQNEQGKILRSLPMQKDREGFHSIKDTNGKAGDFYQLQLSDGRLIPDPSSHYQPFGIHGSSQVIDHGSYIWKNSVTKPIDMRDLIIYELHIGTFTHQGTYQAAIPKLPHLKNLGVTAIELMPLSDFSGRWNWGYDGVMLFAPARCYGTTEDLKHFVDAAHEQELHVILDVVYNHFGPIGNYWHVLTPELFDTSKHTVWGAAISYDIKKTKAVRQLYLENLKYWKNCYQIDGLRLDATHAIYDDSDPHIFAELTRQAHQLDMILIAEDERNERLLLLEREKKGYGFNAVWADDFHHSVRVHLTNEHMGCLKDFTGNPEEITKILNEGWLYSGQESRHLKACRGTACRDLKSYQFIWCISNHDQVGNRPLGQALHHYINWESYAAAVGLLCFSPFTPLLFMGQEWASDSPFLYFTDHPGELGKLITEGRKKDFKEFYEGCHPEQLKNIPDPQDEKTFFSSKLDWENLSKPNHQHIFKLHQKFIHYRRQWLELSLRERNQWEAVHFCDILRIFYQGDHYDLMVISALRKENLRPINIYQQLKSSALNWEILLSSNPENEKEKNRINLKTGELDFKKPETLVLIGNKKANENQRL